MLAEHAPMVSRNDSVVEPIYVYEMKPTSAKVLVVAVIGLPLEHFFEDTMHRVVPDVPSYTHGKVERTQTTVSHD